MAFTLTQPLYGQGGSYTAQQDRLFIKATAVTQGVRKLTAASGGVMTGDLAVTTTGTTNGSVSVSAGEVIVAASTANYGHYFATNDGATTVGSFTANSSGNPRIDLVTVLITDTGATPVVSFAIVAGTPAATPSAPATPSNSLALAQVTIPNGFTVSTTVAAGNITDVRQKAFVPDLSTTSVSATVIPSPTDGNLVYHTTGKQLATYNATTAAWEGSPQTAGFRNAIINGGFDIWQRGTNFTTAGGGYGAADRWYAGFATGSFTQQAFAVGNTIAGYEPQYYGRWTISTNSQNYEFIQKIEGVRSFAGQQVTISFWARATSGSVSVNGRLVQYFGTGGSPSASAVTNFVAPLSLTSGWVRYQYTLTVPSLSGKTVGTVGDDCLWLSFQVVTTATGSIDFWGVQVEKGSVATPFEQRPIGAELALCQRYYQRENDAGIVMGVDQNGTASVGRYVGIQFPVTMRINTYTASATTATGAGTIYKKSVSGMSVSRVAGGTSLGVDLWTWIADAEL